MSHRKEIYTFVQNKWDAEPKLAGMTFHIGKARAEFQPPKIFFYQRIGGNITDTAGTPFIEHIPYCFECFGNSYDVLDEEVVPIIEDTFDRARFTVNGVPVIHMNRSAPTLIEEVGELSWCRAVVQYSISVHLERSREKK